MAAAGESSAVFKGGVATPASIAISDEIQRMVRFMELEDTTMSAPVWTRFRVADDELKQSLRHHSFTGTL